MTRRPLPVSESLTAAIAHPGDRCRREPPARPVGTVPYVLVGPELARGGVDGDVLWDFSRTRDDEGLIAAHSGQHVMREIVADYLTYVGWASDGSRRRLRCGASCRRRSSLIPIELSVNRFSTHPKSEYPTYPEWSRLAKNRRSSPTNWGSSLTMFGPPPASSCAAPHESQIRR